VHPLAVVAGLVIHLPGDELGLGARLAPYTCTADELRTAIDTILADTQLRTRLAAEAERIRSRDGLRRSADLTESAAK